MKKLKLRSKLILSSFIIDILFSVLLIFSAAQAGGTLLTVSIVAVVLLFLLSAWFSFRLAKSFLTPVNEIRQTMDELARGKLHLRVDCEDCGGEVGLLAQSLNAFCDELNRSIEELIRTLEAFSVGDLTIKSNYVWLGDWKEINVAVSKITKNMNLLFSGISNAADQTASGADQVSSGAQALAQGTTEQASSIEELSATIVEISEHVKKTASNAADANRASSVEKEKLGEASTEMQEMVRAMAEISDTSTKISNIIKTIDDIAFQTNILALNAAVEAARAGSAGKGFAVVADEVRNLASKSSEAAKDTTTLIENSIKAVSNGTKVANSTEKILGEVTESAASANQLVNEIADASNQQATSINQITQGVQQISAVVQTNSATAEQSAAASEELSAQAKDLKRSLSSLKLIKQDRSEKQKTVSAERPAEHKPNETVFKSSVSAAKPVVTKKTVSALADKY